MSITRSFEYIGVPLRNSRWSWGASNEHAIVLRVWHDHTERDEDGVRRNLIWRPRWKTERSPGVNERLNHIEEIKAGRPCYVIVVEDANFGTGKPRKIAQAKTRRVFKCGELLFEDGTIKIELLKSLEHLTELKTEIAKIQMQTKRMDVAQQDTHRR